MTLPDTFGALILSGSRPDRVVTADSLRKYGYTGPICIVVDSLDATLEEYQARFGKESVVVFDKPTAALDVDAMDNEPHYRGVVYARNQAFRIAKELGWTHFIMLDDDYTDWRYCFGSDRKYRNPRVRRLDQVFASLTAFLDATPAHTICMSQGGDLLGGADGHMMKSINLGRNGKRKAMNTFVCRTDRPFKFFGRLNEDVNAYVMLGAIGVLMFTTNIVKINQFQTQTNAGGLTELYRDSGTYVKSFYSVIGAPSCVRVYPLNTKYPRWHHRISWRYAVPKILPESARKDR